MNYELIIEDAVKTKSYNPGGQNRYNAFHG